MLWLGDADVGVGRFRRSRCGSWLRCRLGLSDGDISHGWGDWGGRLLSNSGGRDVLGGDLWQDGGHGGRRESGVREAWGRGIYEVD